MNFFISFGLIYHIWAIEANTFLVYIDKKYSLVMSGTDYKNVYFEIF